MPEESIFIAQSNLATTYARLGRFEESTSMARDVYLGNVKLFGKHHRDTLFEANNYAWALVDISRFEEAKSLLRKTVPVAQRILGEGHRVTLKMRWVSAKALFLDTDATLDGLREAVSTLEDVSPTARRLLGGAHPTAKAIEEDLRDARAVLRAREPPSSGSA